METTYTAAAAATSAATRSALAPLRENVIAIEHERQAARRWYETCAEYARLYPDNQEAARDAASALRRARAAKAAAYEARLEYAAALVEAGVPLIHTDGQEGGWFTILTLPRYALGEWGQSSPPAFERGISARGLYRRLTGSAPAQVWGDWWEMWVAGVVNPAPRHRPRAGASRSARGSAVAAEMIGW